MTSGDPDIANEPANSPRFATTHWSVVLAAGHSSSPDSQRALRTLCHTYWYPLYAFVRRQGRSAEDAEDLTQEFFARLLEKDFLNGADRRRGRFRTFLLTIFKRFLATQWEHAQTQKRGGGARELSLDFADAEYRYQLEPADAWTPEKIYQRRWALTLLEHVLCRLRDDYYVQAKQELFDSCQVYLTGSAAGPAYGETAAALGMSEGAVRVAVHRLRQRYRELLKAEVAQTVALPEETNAELKLLTAALRGENI